MQYIVKIFYGNRVIETFSTSKNSKKILQEWGGQRCEVYTPSGTLVSSHSVKVNKK